MRLTVFGGTGGIGRHVVDLALQAGHSVTVLARDGSHVDTRDGVALVVGDIADAEAVARAVAGADAVIWAVGASSNTRDQVALFETGARHLVSAMERHDVRRLIALSGAGITAHGERKPLGGRLMSMFVGVLARWVVEAKKREYEVFSASKLDWTLIRPPGVIAASGTGSYELGTRLKSSRIAQPDLARAMLDLATDRLYLRELPYVS